MKKKEFNKKKIVIYSPNSKILHRDLIDSKFYSEINNNFNVSWVFAGEPSKDFKKIIKDYVILKHPRNFRLLLWEISYYLEELYIHKFWNWPNINTKLYLSKLKRNLINLIFFLKIGKLISIFFQYLLKRTVLKNEIFKNAKLFISFSGGKDLVSEDLFRLAKERKIFNILIPAGWDNISSKSIMVKPNKIFVWGKQTKNLCKKLHKINPEIIGSARFDEFNRYKINKKKAFSILKLNQKFKYILVAGSGVAFSEIKLINILLQYLKMKKLNNYRIIYRPHPNRQKNKNDQIINKEFKEKLILDPTLKRNYKIKDFKILLTASEGLISPFSTSIIESQFVGKPCMAVGYHDEQMKLKFNWKAFVTKSPHLKILRNSKSIIKCYDIDKINKKFDEFFNQIKHRKYKYDRIKLAKEIVYYGKSTYIEKMKKLIHKL